MVVCILRWTCRVMSQLVLLHHIMLCCAKLFPKKTPYPSLLLTILSPPLSLSSPSSSSHSPSRSPPSVITGKNISFLAASASRAAIHKTFAVHENLADITAKTGSQCILGGATALFMSLWSLPFPLLLPLFFWLSLSLVLFLPQFITLSF